VITDMRTRRGGFKTLPYITLFAIFLLLFFAFPARAQEAEPVSTPEVILNPSVTADDVNAIARKMYCPVCENIPLDVCPTVACAQWRDEIRSELEAGKSETQIVDAFVARYGDRVVGTPQDPLLRNLSLVTPWLIGIIIVASAGVILVRWWRKRAVVGSVMPSNSGAATITDDEYRARLERDLQSRR
jgi:cytochrome c-type biogenesis protein CcmH